MKDLWKELVSSLGFIVSAVVVIIILPMIFFAFMGVAGDAESAVGFLIGIIIIGVIMYGIHKIPTQEQINNDLWKDKKVYQDRLKTRNGKIIETKCEYQERIHIRKREHFENITRNYELINKYHKGYKSKNKVDISDIIGRTLVDHRDTSFLNANMGVCSALMIPSDRIKKMQHENGSYTSYSVLQQVVNERINRRYSKNRLEIDQRGEEYGMAFRWASTYAVLKAVYGKQRFFKIALSSDTEEYKILYPFEIEPLVYNFNSTIEEEAKFIKKAFSRIQAVKIEYQKHKFAFYDSAKRNQIYQKYDLLIGYDDEFDWSVSAEKDIQIYRDNFNKNHKRREGVSYERQT